MTKTVLIVEDNELNMKLFHDLLDAHGYQTLQTRNGMEALDARPRAPSRPHPHGHPAAGSVGAGSDQWLKEDDELREIPVIAVTAFAMKGDEERIREGGCEALHLQADLGGHVPRHGQAIHRRGAVEPP